MENKFLKSIVTFFLLVLVIVTIFVLTCTKAGDMDRWEKLISEESPITKKGLLLEFNEKGERITHVAITVDGVILSKSLKNGIISFEGVTGFLLYLCRGPLLEVDILAWVKLVFYLLVFYILLGILGLLFEGLEIFNMLGINITYHEVAATIIVGLAFWVNIIGFKWGPDGLTIGVGNQNNIGVKQMA